MNAQTQNPGTGARTGDSTVRRQLDMLSSGQMDQATFLRATIARLRDDPDENWEVLSLLDQYFRLNKIPGDTFRAVKNALAEFVLRPRGAPAVQGPVPPQTVQLSRTRDAEAGAASRAMHAPAIPVDARAVTQPTESRTPPARTPPAREPVMPRDPAPAPRTRAASAPAVPAASNIVLETPPVAERDLATGDVLRNRYRIESFVGQGGRGMVYAATDAYRLDANPAGQRVAIKLLQRSLAKRADAVLELRREFQLLQSLTHPNIVRAHEFDKDGNLSFFTMELLNGALLTRVAQARQQRPLSRAHALALIRDLGAAISFAHSRGVVHGDINPQNIFVTFDGEVRVLDFGAARRWRRDTPFIGEDDARGSFATVGYASPQVMGGEHAEVQDDIFSLACVAYMLFSGRHPFNEASSLQAQASRVKPKRLSNLKDGPWRALRQALQYDRAKRPENMADFLARLELNHAATRLPNLNELLESPGRSSVRLPWGLIAAGLLIVCGGVYAYLVRQDILPAPGYESTHAPTATVLAPVAGTPDEDLPPAVASPQPAAPAGSASIRPPAALPAPAAAARAPAPVATPAPRTETAAPAAPAHVTLPVHAPADVPPASARAMPPVATPAPAPASPRVDAGMPAATAPAGDAPAVRIATTARLELAADTIDVTPDDAVAHVIVRRRGTLHGEAPFSWWTESGTAKPGTDFEAAAAHVDRIPDGAASLTLTIPLVQTLRAQPRSFYVVIDQTEGGATVTGRTLTMVTLPGTN